MLDDKVGDLQRANAELQRRLDAVLAEREGVIAERNRVIAEHGEALARETAIAEVLQVINSSPGDIKPVFDTILGKALDLCDAAFGALCIYEGDYYRPLAQQGFSPEMRERFRGSVPISPGSNPGRVRAGEEIITVADLNAEPPHLRSPGRKSMIELGGARSAIWVALRKDDIAVGFLGAFRQEVRPFTENQVALLRSFAAQAVIAMENARLINETREALEQQTATAEVLEVINSSPGDLTPVFVAMLEKALRLCEAAFGFMDTYKEGVWETVALREVPPAYAQYLTEPRRAGSGTAHARSESGENLIHIADVAVEALYRAGDPQRSRLVELAGARTFAVAALRKDDELIGAFSIYRQENRPFTDKQIGLLQNFGAQAVIAMENARLLTETREALEQQTATAEVLQVINSSPGDLTPVFEAILEKAHSLCAATQGSMLLRDGDLFRPIALHSLPETVEERLRRGIKGSEAAAIKPLLAGERLVHVTDMAESDLPRARQSAAIGGARTLLSVPLRKGGELFGAIIAGRAIVKPFSEKQIALLENFAAQAVIAMENARLITETREALAQQTGTAEVLQVINSSPGNLAPVFETILEKAHGLCGADFGNLMLYDGELMHSVAFHGEPTPWREYLATPYRPTETSPSWPLFSGAPLIHIADLAATGGPGSENEVRQAAVELGGIRTLLMVPLRKEKTLLGIIVAYCQEVRPFTDRQIALLQNFAAQAVIAMENARLINETREALEQQTATAKVLQVINASPGDLAPVFDAILEKGMRFCEAEFGHLDTYDGKLYRTAAMRGVPAAYAEYRNQNPPSYGPGTGPARMLAGERIVHHLDMKEEEPYRAGEPNRRALVDLGGARSALNVALVKDGSFLGFMTLFRQQVRPFSDKQIALMESFAAQAVIAMDNARLLDEIRQRQAELRVTFENMGDGVAMFDADLRLAAWNRNFQQIIDLPEAVLAERPTYADYLRILAERGEFGTEGVEAELNQRIQDADKELRLERARPDGRIIEVRRNAVPGGGFVLIVSDITERKRAEAEIRTARDTAEKALGELQATQASLIQAEKMASLGQLTAGIAHEIKNPLNFVNNFAGLSIELLDELKGSAAPGIATLDGDTRADIDETVEMLTSNLDKIAEHGKRADNIVKSMLEHSRGVSGERREVELNALVDEALNLAYHGARAQDPNFNITLERDFQPGLAPIEVAPQEMTRVFLNLINNGFYAATKRARDSGNGAFRPTLAVATRQEDDAVAITVRDNGTGIPPEIRDRLFQPFFTTKPTGEGTGLGLSISYDIITQQHGGTITVDSELGAYTEFTIRLPRRIAGGAA